VAAGCRIVFTGEVSASPVESVEIRQRCTGQGIADVGDERAITPLDDHDTGVVKACHNADRDIAEQHSYNARMPERIRGGFRINATNERSDLAKGNLGVIDLCEDRIICGMASCRRTQYCGQPCRDWNRFESGLAVLALANR
jgi:hypothetical protein